MMIRSENENINVDNEDFSSDNKINRSLIHLLKSTTKRSSVVMTQPLYLFGELNYKMIEDEGLDPDVSGSGRRCT